MDFDFLLFFWALRMLLRDELAVAPDLLRPGWSAGISQTQPSRPFRCEVVRLLQNSLQGKVNFRSTLRLKEAPNCPQLKREKIAAYRILRQRDPNNPLRCGSNLMSPKTFGVYSCPPMTGEEEMTPEPTEGNAAASGITRKKDSRCPYCGPYCVVGGKFPP